MEKQGKSKIKGIEKEKKSNREFDGYKKTSPSVENKIDGKEKRYKRKIMFPHKRSNISQRGVCEEREAEIHVLKKVYRQERTRKKMKLQQQDTDVK